jgi:hypothetical protein
MVRQGGKSTHHRAVQLLHGLTHGMSALQSGICLEIHGSSGKRTCSSGKPSILPAMRAVTRKAIMCPRSPEAKGTGVKAYCLIDVPKVSATDASYQDRAANAGFTAACSFADLATPVVSRIHATHTRLILQDSYTSKGCESDWPMLHILQDRADPFNHVGCQKKRNILLAIKTDRQPAVPPATVTALTPAASKAEAEAPEALVGHA